MQYLYFIYNFLYNETVLKWFHLNIHIKFTWSQKYPINRFINYKTYLTPPFNK